MSASRGTRALVLRAPRHLALEERALPEPGPGELLVRVEGCGLCGSNLPVWQGREWFTYPLAPGAPGHEGWGRVVEGGEGTRTPPGTRIAFLSESALAEHDVVREDGCVELPASLDGLDFPGEPLGCAWNAFLRSRIARDEQVAVVGSGFFGACLVRLASARGARVLAISRRATSLRTARELGAERALAWEEDAMVQERVEEWTAGALCRVVLEATGLQRGLDLAARLCGTRGRLVIAGYHQDGPRQVDLQLWNWRGLDVVNAHEREPARYVAGMRAAVQAARDGHLDPRALIMHRVPLERAGEAFRALEQRPEGFLKAVVTMEPAA